MRPSSSIQYDGACSACSRAASSSRPSASSMRAKFAVIRGSWDESRSASAKCASALSWSPSSVAATASALEIQGADAVSRP